MAAKKAKKTIVIGHKNPDTDSICSAICYANLKNLQTGNEYMPGRAGHINPETRFVLDYFKRAEGDRYGQDAGKGYRDPGDKGSAQADFP